MTKDVPYFPLYAANMLAARPFKLMSLKERGLWITLQMECWVNGDTPASKDELAKYLGITINEIDEALTQKQFSFIQNIRDVFISPELEEYRKKYDEIRTKQRLGGLKGAQRKKTKLQQQSITQQGQPIGQPEGSLSYINLNSVKSSSVISNQLGEERLINKEAQAWVDDYEKAIGAWEKTEDGE